MKNLSTLENIKIALIGCGDIGCRLGLNLIQQGAEVHGFRRSIEKIPAGIIAHSVDVQNPETLSVLGSIAFDYIVVTLSPNEMSDAAYKETYVDGLKNILANINQTALNKLIWVSSTSVYGQNDGSDIDENSATEPTRYSGIRQLEAEQCLKPLKDKSCVVRFGGIYRDGKHRIIEKLQNGILSRKVDNDYMTNRIHIADCVGVLEHFIQSDIQGKVLQSVYIAVDSAPVLYSELIQWLSKTSGLPLSEEGVEQTPRVGSKRCSNQRLLDSGYEFIYPSYKEGFRAFLLGF